jgi:predicted nucleic acid-binding protein
MKTLADTSCLVAAMIEAHPVHVRALVWFEQVRSEKNSLLVCVHTLAELYAVLTRLPLKPRIGPDLARRLIRENVEAAATVIALEPSDYAAVLDRMAELGLSGGVIYDALAVRAAEKAGVGRLVTLNETDFRRLCPDGGITITTP